MRHGNLHRIISIGIAAFMLAALAFVALPVNQHAQAATVYYVNLATSVPDANVNDGRCDTVLNDGIGVDTCTLRAAIMQANAVGGDVEIVIPVGTNPSVDGAGDSGSASTDDLDISNNANVTIFAGNLNTPDVTISKTGGVGRVFDVASGSLTIWGATISLGNGVPTGAGIRVQGGTVNLNYVTVTGNVASSASGPASGGGIDAANGTTVSISNSTISNNDADVTGGSNSSTGGGLSAAASSTVTITRSIISGNRARVIGGATGGSASGGGIFLGGGTLTVTESQINNNTVTGHNGTGGASGGGIHSAGTLTVSRSSIFLNVVLGYDLGARGAGISVAGGSAAVNDTLIDSNSLARIATATDPTSSGTADGGGIATSVALTLTNVTISSNSVDNQANTVATADEFARGGGVYNGSGAAVSISRSILLGNTRSSAAGLGGGPDCFGAFTSDLKNHVGDLTDLTCTGFDTTTDGIAPEPDGDTTGPAALGGRADPADATYTLPGGALPQVRSPAGAPNVLANVNAVACTGTDQRGLARSGVDCDKGAYEEGPVIPTGDVSITSMGYGPGGAFYTYTYDVTVSYAAGTLASADGNLAMYFPPGFNVNTWNCTSSTCGTVNGPGDGFTYSGLTNGDFITYQITGTFDSPLPNALNIRAQAYVTLANGTDTAPANNYGASPNLTYATLADPGIVVFDSPDPISPGGTLTFSVTLFNAGPADATNFKMRSIGLAGNVTIVTPLPVSYCSVVAGEIECSIPGTVLANTSLIDPLALQVQTIGVVNPLTVQWVAFADQLDKNSVNSRFTTSTVIAPPTATPTLTPIPPTASWTPTRTLIPTVTPRPSNTPVPTATRTLTPTLTPTTVPFPSATSRPSSTPRPGSSGDNTGGSSAGTPTPVSVGDVSGGDTSNLTNQIVVNMEVSQPDPIEVGSPVTWTVTITNPTEDTSLPVQFSTTAPEEFIIDRVNPQRGSVTRDGQVVDVALGQIEPGETLTIRMETTLNPDVDPGQPVPAGDYCMTGYALTQDGNALAFAGRDSTCLTVGQPGLSDLGGRFRLPAWLIPAICLLMGLLLVLVFFLIRQMREDQQTT